MKEEGVKYVQDIGRMNDGRCSVALPGTIHVFKPAPRLPHASHLLAQKCLRPSIRDVSPYGTLLERFLPPEPPLS